MKSRSFWIWLACVTVVLLAIRVELSAAPGAAADPAVERARGTVRMLDDLHKLYVVNMTVAYAKGQVATPASKISGKVFKDMEAKGWGKVRLVDATGKPLNAENAPQTPFEKSAIAALRRGESYFEELAGDGDRRTLRAATVVPAVMPQCVTCHPSVKEGQLLGSLVYELPVR